jgi:hypothetical protein
MCCVRRTAPLRAHGEVPASPMHALTLHRGVRILMLMDSAARARRIEGYYYYRPALRGMGWVGVRTA